MKTFKALGVPPSQEVLQELEGTKEVECLFYYDGPMISHHKNRYDYILALVDTGEGLVSRPFLLSRWLFIKLSPEQIIEYKKSYKTHEPTRWEDWVKPDDPVWLMDMGDTVEYFECKGSDVLGDYI